MDKVSLISLISSNFKVIRSESDLSQNEMAEQLGISKKTLIEIEKGRTKASWTVVVAVSSIFSNSRILRNLLGDKPYELVKLIVNANDESLDVHHDKLFWNLYLDEEDFIIYKNIICEHYKIEDSKHRRIFSSFSIKETMDKLEELREKKL